MKSSLRLRRSLGYSSTRAVMKPSTVQNFRKEWRSVLAADPSPNSPEARPSGGKPESLAVSGQQSQENPRIQANPRIQVNPRIQA